MSRGKCSSCSTHPGLNGLRKSVYRNERKEKCALEGAKIPLDAYAFVLKTKTPKTHPPRNKSKICISIAVTLVYLERFLEVCITLVADASLLPLLAHPDLFSNLLSSLLHHRHICRAVVDAA